MCISPKHSVPCSNGRIIYSWLVMYSWLKDSNISVWNKSRRSDVTLLPILVGNVYRHNLEVLTQVIIPDENHGCFTQRVVLLSSLLCVPQQFRTLGFFIGYKISGLTKPLFLSLLKIFREWWPISTVFLSCIMSSSVWYNSPHIFCFSAYPEIKEKYDQFWTII